MLQKAVGVRILAFEGLFPEFKKRGRDERKGGDWYPPYSLRPAKTIELEKGVTLPNSRRTEGGTLIGGVLKSSGDRDFGGGRENSIAERQTIGETASRPVWRGGGGKLSSCKGRERYREDKKDKGKLSY